MSENCTHNCSSCGSNCSSREPESRLAALNPKSSVKKVVGIISGKGGVGKSLVTSLLACAMQRRGRRSAVLDADLTGPSIPHLFGVEDEGLSQNDDGILPAVSFTGIQIMSINLMLDETTKPVAWRGPVVAGAVRQFWSGVVWDNVDHMFVDMPPGTGDVPLTVFQSLPVDGVIVVATPQELVTMIVSKAVTMANMMNVPIIGLVENMSYYVCPDCGSSHSIFGGSRLDDAALRFGLPILARLPIDPRIAAACDAGKIETLVLPELDVVVDAVEALG